jgi:hypothetical protein
MDQVKSCACGRPVPYGRRGSCEACYQRQWRARNPERQRKYHENWLQRYPGRRAVQNRKNSTGFTPELVTQCREVQAGRCAICRVLMDLDRKTSAAGEHADHCHVGRTPRGLLCRTCNVSLGSYEKHQRPRGLVIEPYEAYLANPPAKGLL